LHPVLRAIHHRNRSAPVALPADEPILEPVGDGGLAEPPGGGVGRHLLDRLLRGEAVELPAVHEPAGAVVGGGKLVGLEGRPLRAWARSRATRVLRRAASEPPARSPSTLGCSGASTRKVAP